MKRIMLLFAVCMIILSAQPVMAEDSISSNTFSDQPSKNAETSIEGKTKNERIIIKRTKTFLNAVKSYDQNRIKSSFVPKKYRGYINFYDKGTYIEKYIRKLNKKYFKYTIKAVSAGKAKGTVKVKVTYYDGYELYEAAFWDALDYLDSHPSYSLTDKSINKLIYKYIKSNYKNFPPKKHKESVTIKIPFRKIDGKWRISKMSRKLNDAVNCSLCLCAIELSDRLLER